MKIKSHFVQQIVKHCSHWVKATFE